ncbi:lysophospholipid acyltransferase family protein [Flavobacterium sp. JP2137]|uniref:lysophospholipid acyltransferase family protein n=1 Tax=Flavobacterium sp. JP2137 TaxID=3414510 RepID=UPI003D2FDAC0
MKLLKTVCWILWKIWFYFLMTVVIVVLSPLLILTISSDKTYPYFFVLARFWATVVFFGMGFRYRVEWQQKPEPGKSYMLIANHTSMMDIMLMLILIKDNPFVFIGKQELAKLPIFGYFYKRTCILVDRGNSKSRMLAIKSAEDKLKLGLSICIFPEGGVSDDKSVVLDEFKDGAFRLAIEHQIEIIPMTFGCLRHYFPFAFLAGHPARVPIVIHPFISTSGKTTADKKALKEQARAVMLAQVLVFEADYQRKYNG